jgi:hypothetical protein
VGKGQSIPDFRSNLQRVPVGEIGPKQTILKKPPSACAKKENNVQLHFQEALIRLYTYKNIELYKMSSTTRSGRSGWLCADLLADVKQEEVIYVVARD